MKIFGSIILVLCLAVLSFGGCKNPERLLVEGREMNHTKEGKERNYSAGMKDWLRPRFVKYSGNPILFPTGTGWESMAVLAPTVVIKGEKFYMFYRGDDWSYVRWIEDQPFPRYDKKGGWACIGLATSQDGIHFERYANNPLITPEYEFEKPWGCEDPRIAKIGDTYVLTYRAGGRHIALATSTDLFHWRKEGRCLPDWDATNSGAIVPEKINGRYVMYHGDSNIWVAYSTDLVHWESEKDAPVMTPREGYFDDSLVEPGPPPVVTEKEIVLIYHGRNKKTWAYSLGVAIFSKEDPEKLLYRSDRPFLEPSEEWEINGKAYNVIFAEGLVNYRGIYYLYYSGSDTYIGVAIGKQTRRK
ncbi:MAG: glycoside hydrolase family 130 protein [bacterium]|nr:glycoside hydrolase family 130 protein [bacterium]